MEKSKVPAKRRTKFINVQPHRASCGPVAIANMIKWAGIETSYKKVLSFCLATKAYDPNKGMFPFQMRYILRTFAIKFRVRKKFSVEDLDSLLTSGGACIFVYETKQGSGHVVFIDKKLDGGYQAWNRKKNHPPFFSDTELAETLERSRNRGQLYVYSFQGLTDLNK